MQAMKRKDNNEYIIPDWPAPSWIKSAVSTRKKIGQNPYDSFNIAFHVNDDIAKVASNREQLITDLSIINSPFWLEQVHGINSIELLKDENRQTDYSPANNSADNRQLNNLVRADASYTKQKELPCVVMTADCLPLFLTNKNGTWISAIHAGWRGLCKGIVESTVAKYEGESAELIAWLGPAISQTHFEVGAEVREAFLAVDKDYESGFKSHKPNYYMADLYFIARKKLSFLNIKSYGGDLCTFEDSERFYSYRRDAETGRMASLIWIEKRSEQK
ncbi:MAG: multi-copper polyphenol oxidoreductase [Kangiella sp.]|nr:MAG: multi-copper polyphenol oxidoreductase [Kangiella sp.]